MKEICMCDRTLSNKFILHFSVTGLILPNFKSLYYCYIEQYTLHIWSMYLKNVEFYMLRISSA